MKIKKGKSLCFFSAKGGVGKTTNLLNLAGIFEQLEKKVLIIDMDLSGGSIAYALSKEYDRSLVNLAEDILYNRFTSMEDYVTEYDQYIDLLCASKDPKEANKLDYTLIEDIIHKAEFNYEIVLIDMDHTLSACNLAILDTVSEIYFMTTNDPMDLKNMHNLLTIFKDLSFQNYKIILNNSRDPFKDYFSFYDIKNILDHNVDYTLSPLLFLKDMERYVMEGVILSLDKKFSSMMAKDYQTFLTIATDFLGGEKDA